MAAVIVTAAGVTIYSTWQASLIVLSLGALFLDGTSSLESRAREKANSFEKSKEKLQSTRYFSSVIEKSKTLIRLESTLLDFHPINQHS